MDWKTLAEQQKIVVQTLLHALVRKKLAHAYLFEGPMGTGKRETAILLAQALLCEAKEAEQPCGKCRNCRRVASGNHPDVIRISAETAAIKKEQITLLMKEFAYHSAESPFKIFIIEEAEKLTKQAENSLLKFIEDPQPGVLALLTTDQINQILDTVRSRCQVLTFKPLLDEQTVQTLITDGFSLLAARLAVALTHDYAQARELCRTDSFADVRSLVLQLTQIIADDREHALPFIYDIFYPALADSAQLAVALHLLLLWYRDVLHMHIGCAEHLLYESERSLLERQLGQYTQLQTVNMIEKILSALKQLDAHVNPLSVLEWLVNRQEVLKFV
ncbi:MAG: DNA polymerase III subunit delta' [Sporolactobacillus sp.]